MTAVETRYAADLQCVRIAPVIKAALIHLLEAYEYALEMHRDVWDFAVEITTLYADGPGTNDIRWLISKGFVESALETTKPIDRTRKFLKQKNLALCQDTCFVLTKRGCGFAAAVRDGLGIGPTAYSSFKGSSLIDPVFCRALQPKWDRECHILRVGQCVIKQFRLPSPNQEAVLSAFQEEDWPCRIDDPIPPSPGMDSKRRLHDTIKCLNRHRLMPLICFRGDGTGKGILWERTENSLPDSLHIGEKLPHAA